eukprot:3046681-Prorocentrum_lima.AAC.1
MVCPDNGAWAYPDGYSPGGARSQEGSEYRDATTGAVLNRKLVEEARAEEIRFMQSWQVWEVRPIAECRARTGKNPIGG